MVSRFSGYLLKLIATLLLRGASSAVGYEKIRKFVDIEHSQGTKVLYVGLLVVV